MIEWEDEGNVEFDVATKNSISLDGVYNDLKIIDAKRRKDKGVNNLLEGCLRSG